MISTFCRGCRCSSNGLQAPRLRTKCQPLRGGKTGQQSLYTQWLVPACPMLCSILANLDPFWLMKRKPRGNRTPFSGDGFEDNSPPPSWLGGRRPSPRFGGWLSVRQMLSCQLLFASRQLQDASGADSIRSCPSPSFRVCPPLFFLRVPLPPREKNNNSLSFVHFLSKGGRKTSTFFTWLVCSPPNCAS